MSQFTTEEMSRLVAAGTRNQLKTAIDVVAGLSTVHINEYSSTEEGLSMGTPSDESESISRRLTKMRGAASNLQAADQRELLSAPEVRRTLSGPIDELVDSALESFEELDTLRNEFSQVDEELEVLQMLSPLSLELDLMGGYQNVTSFIGTVSSLTKARPDFAAHVDSRVP
jgi:vacuolar-type H+-ATPase subunit I/STV1